MKEPLSPLLRNEHIFITNELASLTMSDSFDDSEPKASPRQSSASISFSTHTFPLDYSSELDTDDVNSLLLPISPVAGQEETIPISPVSPQSQEDEEKEEEMEAEMDNDVKHEERSISLLEASADVPNELSISKTSQTSRCNEQNANGQSPLSISSSKCFLGGIKLLVERGANINIQDAFGRTPLHLVCENANSDNHHDSLDYLLRGADPCIQDLQGRTPLHIAANAGCVVCINKLLEHDADPNIRDSSGEIPLHIAARMLHLECMEALSPSCEDSTSSVASTSSIIQIENDTSFYHFAGDRMTRSMQEMTGKESWHDSGYFTARGNAWTKSKYYPSNKIEEEIDSSQSTLHSESDSSLSQQESNAGVQLTRTRWNTLLELFLRLALYVIDSFLTRLRKHIVTDAPLMKKGSLLEESRLSFQEPPAHIKEAMERFKQQQESKSQK